MMQYGSRVLGREEAQRKKVEEQKRCFDGRWQKRALGGNYLIPERTCRVGRVWCGRVFFLVGSSGICRFVWSVRRRRCKGIW